MLSSATNTITAHLQLLDIDDLSRLLKRSKAALWRDHEAGAIPRGMKLGRSVRWRQRDIERFIENGCVVDVSDAADETPENEHDRV